MHIKLHILYAYKIQMPRNYPQESIQHSEHGESLKSKTPLFRVSHLEGTPN